MAVPTRDGALLKCNVARPAGDGRWPVIVCRTPYGKDSFKSDPLMDLTGIAREGFVVVLQDVRQRFRSGGDGDFVPFVHEGADGEDLVAWAAAQPFSTGDVFAVGASYSGVAQWAAAVRQPAALRAIAPHQSPSNPASSLFFRGGVLELECVVPWLLAFHVNTIMRRHAQDPAAMGRALTTLLADLDTELASALASLPIDPLAPLARHGLDAALHDIVAGDAAQQSPMWRALCEAQAFERVTVPALISGGWYDIFCQGAIDQFIGMCTRGGSAEARERTRLIVGPWTHASQSATQGERYFGLRSSAGAMGKGGLRGETLRFFREPVAAAPVTIFVMGANEWRDEHEWPIARTTWTPWHLSSGGHANSLEGDGVLSADARPSAADRFDYDPANPVPTWGGGIIGIAELAGPRDQRVIERRDDVLVYTSDVLARDMEVTGSVVVELWAASSAVDTDFVARLVDVQPDGTAYNVADGILRGRYRADANVRGDGVPLVPFEPALFRIELTPTSNLFKAGHRIRLDVTSSCFPRWARNLNVWDERGATLADATVAHQQILHDAQFASRVLLPVVPPR